MNFFHKWIWNRRQEKTKEELEEQFWEESLWNRTYFNQKDGAEDAEEDTLDESLVETIEEDDEYEEKKENTIQERRDPFSWESLSDERNTLRISDPYQREKYIRSMVAQVKNASGEIDKLSYEYNVVTAALKDMDELDALPESEKIRVEECAKRVISLEKETADYEKMKNRMPESEYYKMEQYEDSASAVYNEMKKSEQYREYICEDLSRLDSEKEAYSYRLEELRRGLANGKGMVMITLVAMILLYAVLLVMQFLFSMEVAVGYILTTIAGALCITYLYMRYMDEKQELAQLDKRRNRIILLQNTVKIRYVNNTNLLDYLYLKYQVKSAREWKHLMTMYQEEKDSREQNAENEEQMSYWQSELLKILRCFQLSDARVWVRRPLALCDHKEMVEIRHEHIVRRQKLRAQMDYNRRLVREGKQALAEFQKEFPEYQEEVKGMQERVQM